jgi:hypothetical protein
MFFDPIRCTNIAPPKEAKSLKNIKYFFIFILFLSIGYSNAYSATYYIANNGNDSNSGSLSQPWRTLKYAAERAVAGDTVYCRGGVHNLTERVRMYNDGPITFKNYAGEVPVFRKITGDEGAAVSIYADNITVQGLKLVWANNTNGGIVGIKGKNITIKNCSIYFEPGTYTKYDCIKIKKGSDTVIIENNEIYGAPNQGIDSVGGDNIKIRNNIIYNCNNAIVLKGGSDNNIIEYNRVYNLRSGAIYLGGTTDPEYIDYYGECTNSIVRYNVIYNDKGTTGAEGIRLSGAIRSKVYNNTIYTAGGIHLKRGGDPNKLQFVSKDNEIYNNIFWRIGVSGILVIDPGNDNGLTLRNNLFWKTSGSGEFKINGKWYDYSEYQSLVSYDHDSQFQDPLFKDLGSRDFSLSNSSPAIDGGYAISGSQPDIGALEKSDKMDDDLPLAPKNLRVLN